MEVDLSNGKDSFRATGGAARRNVEVHLHISTPQMGGFKYIYPAFQQKMPGTGTKRLIKMVYASSVVRDSHDQWFQNRYELQEGTLVIIERKAFDGARTFSATTKYIVLRCDMNAALCNIITLLPNHPSADIDSLLNAGRFAVLEFENDCSYKELEKLRRFFQYGEDNDLHDIMGNEAWEDCFVVHILEKKIADTAKVVRKQRKGKVITHIRRTRKLKT